MKAIRDFSVLAESARANSVRRARIKEMRQAMDDAVRLGELRSSRRVTPQDLADSLDVSPAKVSGTEHASNLYLSTLRSYVEALGGELRLSAVFDDEAVEIVVGD